MRSIARVDAAGAMWMVACCCLAAADQPAASPEVRHQQQQVRIDGRVQDIRLVNGRWWSADNRELKRAGSRWAWAAGGGSQVRQYLRFDHHDPCDPDRVELLDRTMGPDQVRSLLGPPNAVFPSNRKEIRQTWFYYGPAGFKLVIQFSWKGLGIQSASVAVTEKAALQEVSHLTFRTLGNGSDDIDEESPRNRAMGHAAESALDSLAVENGLAFLNNRLLARRGALPESAAGAGASRARTGVTSADPAIQSLSSGMPRTRVIELLGEPYTRYSIQSVEGFRETLVYRRGGQMETRIIVVDGKLAEIRLPDTQ